MKIRKAFMKFRPFLCMIAVVAVTFSMTSCVKNYTCQCNIYYSGVPGLPDSTVQQYGITDTKSNATSKCKAESGTYTNGGITTVENCYIY